MREPAAAAADLADADDARAAVCIVSESWDKRERIKSGALFVCTDLVFLSTGQ